MPSLSVRLDAADLARLNKRISSLLHDTLNLEPVWQQAAQYMRNSTENRILRTKLSPEGERWAALADITVAIKGHDQPLFHTGGLAESIVVSDVSNDGFMITADAPHASWMHKGVAKKRIPARPFMGFSDENVRRISKMVRDYLANGGGQ